MVETKLNFFLIGAPKAGTTFIHERLSYHRQVFLSPLKEPNHFATDIQPHRFSTAFKANHPDDLGSYFARRPLVPRQVGFVQDPDQYAALFEEAAPEHKVVGECSTSYLWSAEAASMVAARHPEARILAVLRNPVDRLYSHWLMARKYGFTGDGLMEAVEKDRRHANPGWGCSELFVEAGLYAKQLERWYAAFPAGQIKVLLHEDLSDPDTWNGLADWLQLEGPIPAADSERVNQAGLPRWEGLNRWLTATGLKGRLSGWLPDRIKSSLRNNWYSSQGVPALDSADRRVLFGLFEEDVTALESVIGRDLGHWRP